MDTDTAFPLPDPVVNLVISEHALLAIRSDTRWDPGSPGYDMGVPPATYDEAMRRPDAGKWQAAMEKEMGLLRDMKVYDLVSLPPGAHAIGSRWVLEYKSRDGKGGPVEKAHFVAKGFTQVPGRDFGRTFAPVARQSSIHESLLLTALRKTGNCTRWTSNGRFCMERWRKTCTLGNPVGTKSLAPMVKHSSAN